MAVGAPFIYLDNAATSWPKAPGVAEAVARSLTEPFGNSGRGAHAAVVSADRLTFEARTTAARLFHFPSSERLIFTPGTTASLNLVLRGTLRRGGVVAVSAMEHNAVMRPVRALEKELGLSVRVFRDNGAFQQIVEEKPDLLVFTSASNVTGEAFPFQEMAQAASRVSPETLICIDAAQSAGEVPIDLGSFPFDFFCVSPHKGLLSPAGLGLLFLGPRAAPTPLFYGGTGNDSESEEQPAFFPDRYESGTGNLPAIAGLLAATRYLMETGVPALAARRKRNAEMLREGVLGTAGFRIHGPAKPEQRLSILSITHERIQLDELARKLDERGVACRHGLHCAPAAHRSIGTLSSGGTVRLSPGPFTTQSDVDQAVLALREIGAES
ncbi:MAG: aminotransferase class V-fold PLP-dependent enzyme [Spirochaetia bacterium]|jgi:selenocysteine lyase/cysteine desulfurase